MIAHTPGPWRANPILTASENARGWNIVRDHAAPGGFIGSVSPLCNPSGEASDEGKANARLIAAAPDLLGALQSLIAEYGPQMASMRIDSPRRAFWRAARDAIAKATGEPAMSAVAIPDCLRINGRRVTVTLDPPPIPSRQFDYRAAFNDGDEYSPVGYGSTPVAALEDLKSWDDLSTEEEA